MCRYVVLSHRGSNQGCVMFLDHEIEMISLQGKQISSFCVQELIFPANIICTHVFVASSRASWKSAPWVYASGGVIFGRSKLPILPGLEPGIPWFVVRCLIHWATGPKKFEKNKKVSLTKCANVREIVIKLSFCATGVRCKCARCEERWK